MANSCGSGRECAASRQWLRRDGMRLLLFGNSTDDESKGEPFGAGFRQVREELSRNVGSF